MRPPVISSSSGATSIPTDYRDQPIPVPATFRPGAHKGYRSPTHARHWGDHRLETKLVKSGAVVVEWRINLIRNADGRRIIFEEG